MSPSLFDSADEPDADVMDVADEVAYADTGRPWGHWRPAQQDGRTAR